MSRSFGTGQPLQLKCSQCKLTRDARGYAKFGRLIRTGRTKPRRTIGGEGRMGRLAYECWCEECGHFGWYGHSDVMRRPIQQFDAAKWLSDVAANAQMCAYQSPAQNALLVGAAEIRRLNEYANRLAAGLPEGMLPKDIEVLREANAQLATENAEINELYIAEGLKRRNAETQLTDLQIANGLLRDKLKETETTLDGWYRLEARLHAAIHHFGGGEIIRKAIAATGADLKAHNPRLINPAASTHDSASTSAPPSDDADTPDSA